MPRKLTLAACVLWIAGIAAFIIGLNVQGNPGKWLTVAGEIAFFAGLALEGVLYFRKRSSAPEESPETQKPEE